MMKRGRKPKSQAAKRLSGTDRKDRPSLRVIESPQISHFDTPPDWFSDDARAEWDRVIPLLKRNGLLDDLYHGLVVMLCAQSGRFVQKMRIDQPVTAAEVAQLRHLYGEFSLTPTTLAVPTTKEPDPENPFLKYARQPPRDLEE